MTPVLRSIVLALACVAIVPLVTNAGTPETDPLDILKKVDAAAKAIKTVEYETEFQGVGDSAARTPRISAKIISEGFDGNRPKRFRVELHITAPGSEQVKHLTVGSDGDEFYVIDHANKKAYVDIDPAVFGSAGNAVARATVLEFGHPKPFSDEINGKTVELRGTCTVNGDDGYEIFVAYANGAREALWCFSKTTYLPRRRIDTFVRRAGGKRMQQRTITKLRVLNGVSDDRFKPQIPDGFETVDDFYPQ